MEQRCQHQLGGMLRPCMRCGPAPLTTARRVHAAEESWKTQHAAMAWVDGTVKCWIATVGLIPSSAIGQESLRYIRHVCGACNAMCPCIKLSQSHDPTTGPG